jgi:hypothetical protein
MTWLGGRSVTTDPNGMPSGRGQRAHLRADPEGGVAADRPRRGKYRLPRIVEDLINKSELQVYFAFFSQSSLNQFQGR